MLRILILDSDDFLPTDQGRDKWDFANMKPKCMELEPSFDIVGVIKGTSLEIRKHRSGGLSKLALGDDWVEVLGGRNPGGGIAISSAAFLSDIGEFELERFLVGPENRPVLEAANAFVDGSGIFRNGLSPLFLSGPPGVGKTHLLVGIGRALLQAKPLSKVIYLKMDAFFDRLSEAIKSKNTTVLRRQFQAADLLLLEGLHILFLMERTQEELRQILEAAMESGTRVVASSDIPLQSLRSKLHPRLFDLLTGGLALEVQPPGLETRKAILRGLVEAESSVEVPAVSERAIELIAESVEGSVRALKGLLNRVRFEAQYRGAEPSPEEIERMLRF
ncbi:DnaA ATPase domain-containing protein [Holophaga foetida]|uniref:DnaA/Hda family protein n=1 Tax=Holophaga foetida TaxID=35839 RepID=UPI0002471C4A|nr:DnaA/Hda family protein [Holophaga foetida]